MTLKEASAHAIDSLRRLPVAAAAGAAVTATAGEAVVAGAGAAVAAAAGEAVAHHEHPDEIAPGFSNRAHALRVGERHFQRLSHSITIMMAKLTWLGSMSLKVNSLMGLPCSSTSAPPSIAPIVS